MDFREGEVYLWGRMDVLEGEVTCRGVWTSWKAASKKKGSELFLSANISLQLKHMN